jgi:hypothetical protein
MGENIFTRPGLPAPSGEKKPIGLFALLLQPGRCALELLTVL